MMQRYALLGWPVKHSVSPQMQEAGFQALGIEARYDLVEVPPHQLGDCVARLLQEGCAGWNITVPHKEQMVTLVDEVDRPASAAGSVNTVVNQDGRLLGYSTDGYGLARALKEAFGSDVAQGRFFFLGTGGAARATSVYLACQGAAEIILTNRTVERAQNLATTIRQAAPQCAVTVHGLDDVQNVAADLERMDCLIQATSLGLHEGDPLPLDPALVPSQVAVMDMIYRDTPFLVGCAERGCHVADGRGMLLYQGVRSFELWTGRPAPVDAMRAALDSALQSRC